MPRINWISVQGFRSFGAASQRLDFNSRLSVVWGSNSQGKTSLAEAIEFLLTGRTVRREFVASATREFSDCLRNAHLDAGAEVSVTAEVVGSDGVAHTVKRRLTSDYSATAACASDLTIDGTAAQDLSALGIRLSHPPLAAPILMQHSLRFVLSAKPQERTDYFKALLEVADLEEIRAAIDHSKPGTAGPSDPLVRKLEGCTGRAELSNALRPLLREDPTAARLRGALAAGVSALLPADDGADKPLEERVAQLKVILADKRKTSFPVGGLQRGSTERRRQPEAAVWKDLHDFADRVAAVDKEAARLTQLFAQLLQVPSVAGASAPVDCPVCETAGGLTPARIEAIRSEVKATAEYRESHGKAVAHLRALSSIAELAERVARQTIPPSVAWDTNARAERGFGEQAMLDLLGEGERERIAAWKAEDASLVVALAAVSELASQLRVQLSSLKLDDLTKDQVDQVKTEFERLEGCATALDAAATDALPAYEAILKSLEEEVGKRTKTEGWQDLVELVEARDKLLSALIGLKARQQAVAEWERAIRDVDAAIAQVFDAKFADLGSEITRWWKLLRPDELTTFAGVQRAGTGRRFIDLKAGLAPNAGGSGVKVRDAVAVFSDSQMNCLGLAAFLARGVREKVGFVVLDDPVPASDREHRAMFLHKVLEELVNAGFQVILLTHDDDTWKDVQERYKHLNLDTYILCLNDAARGTEAKNTGDTFEVMLDRARPFIRNADSEIRKIGAERLRDAAERFGKVLLVRDRQAKGDTSAALSDYDGYTLGQLQPKVDPLLTKDAADSGKLRTLTRHLNPGNHDDQVPAPGDLAVCLGDLEAFKRSYLA